ncbi:hypothetical protein EXN66_Car020654 [Channa argus]|uniref:Uncharacterized protein n=1 Tax=Channa argus TaxID=215402 RepID=A0A6G1QRP3_CHAAH|nr:hypothetical protein EXN66_Car020654 [Channa argus]
MVLDAFTIQILDIAPLLPHGLSHCSPRSCLYPPIHPSKPSVEIALPPAEAGVFLNCKFCGIILMKWQIPLFTIEPTWQPASYLFFALKPK